MQSIYIYTIFFYICICICCRCCYFSLFDCLCLALSLLFDFVALSSDFNLNTMKIKIQNPNRFGKVFVGWTRMSIVSSSEQVQPIPFKSNWQFVDVFFSSLLSVPFISNNWQCKWHYKHWRKLLTHQKTYLVCFAILLKRCANKTTTTKNRQTKFVLREQSARIGLAFGYLDQWKNVTVRMRKCSINFNGSQTLWIENWLQST